MKAIICDDDGIILKGLCSVIDWQNIGVELVGTATNGREGMKLLKTCQPQLLMTDIRMPHIDGLALIEAAKKEHPDLMTIVFSGYDDFEYARKALKLGVQDYLSKPINIDELVQVVMKCVREYQLSKTNEYNDKEDLMRKLIMNMAVTEQPSSEDIDSYCMVIIIESLDGQEFIGAVSQLVKRQGAFILSQKEHRCEVAVLAATSLSVQMQGNYLLTNIRKLFKEQEKKVTCAVSRIRKNTWEIRHCYQEALDIWKLKYIKGDNQDLYYENQEQPRPLKDAADLLNIDLFSPIKDGNTKLLGERLKLLEFQFAGMGQDSYLYMQFIVGNLYSNIIKELGQAGIFVDSLFQNPVAEYRRFLECYTMKDALAVLSENLFDICAHIQECDLKNFSAPVYRALQYVHSNYHSFEITAEEAAKEAGLSMGRFSTLFKQETGYTFTDYLLKTRMEKAKELMKNPAKKIYEVAMAAGYENIPYFSTAFKRYTGVSPSEYRTNHTHLQHCKS